MGKFFYKFLYNSYLFYVEWFPDRKGLASGVCIAGFGSGALIMAPYV